MGIQEHLLQQWSRPEVPQPVLLSGAGAFRVAALVAATRTPTMVFTTGELTAVSLRYLDAWRGLAVPGGGWKGLMIALDTVAMDPLAEALLDRWVIEATGEVGMIFSWEGPTPRNAFWRLAEHCLHWQLGAALASGTPHLLSGTKGEIARATVVTVLTALARKEREVLERALTVFGALEMIALRRWHFEAVTGQWEFFTAADSAGFHQNKPFLMHLLKQFDMRSDSRILAKSVFLPMVVD